MSYLGSAELKIGNKVTFDIEITESRVSNGLISGSFSLKDRDFFSVINSDKKIKAEIILNEKTKLVEFSIPSQKVTKKKENIYEFEVLKNT